MIDIASQIDAIHRQVSTHSTDNGELVSVLLRRTYPAPLADVWDALADPDRLKRWFLPISGDLRVGGSFQLKGNAGGEILACAPPRLLKVTFGGPTSIVELRLAPDRAATTFEFEHTVPIEIAGSGAGSLYVGPGWDGAVMGLALYLAGERIDDPATMANSPEVQAFLQQSIHAWANVIETSGTATPDELAATAAASLAHFAPDVTTPQNGNART